MEKIKNAVLKITKNHTGKMAGFWSLSTACICNTRCAKYAAMPGTICSKCYAQNMFKRYGEAFNNAFINNYNILTSAVLPSEYLPVLNCLYFRFEAFGDLQNPVQFINYLNICYKNPGVNFAIWTKNPDIIKKVLNMGYKKPDNLNILISALYLNKSIDIAKYNFADKIFTVYDKTYIEKNQIEINCGARDCMSCLKCYTKNNVKYINEKLK